MSDKKQNPDFAVKKSLPDSGFRTKNSDGTGRARNWTPENPVNVKLSSNLLSVGIIYGKKEYKEIKKEKFGFCFVFSF